MEYDDKAEVGQFKKYMIPLMKNVVKMQNAAADKNLCQPGLYYDVKPLQPMPPAARKRYEELIARMMESSMTAYRNLQKAKPAKPTQNEVVIED